MERQGTTLCANGRVGLQLHLGCLMHSQSLSTELQKRPSEDFLCVLIFFPMVSICLGTWGRGRGGLIVTSVLLLVYCVKAEICFNDFFFCCCYLTIQMLLSKMSCYKSKEGPMRVC